MPNLPRSPPEKDRTFRAQLLDADDNDDNETNGSENGEVDVCGLCERAFGTEVGSVCHSCKKYFHAGCLNDKHTPEIADFVRGFDFIQLKCTSCLSAESCSFEQTDDSEEGVDCSDCEDFGCNKCNTCKSCDGTGCVECFCFSCSNILGSKTAQCDKCDRWVHFSCFDVNMNSHSFELLNFDCVQLVCHECRKKVDDSDHGSVRVDHQRPPLIAQPNGLEGAGFGLDPALVAQPVPVDPDSEVIPASQDEPTAIKDLVSGLASGVTTDGAANTTVDLESEAVPVTGWRVIYSKSDPLSNFFEFVFFFRGIYYRFGVEQAYHHQRALKENIQLATQIMKAMSSREAHDLGKQLKRRELDSDQQKLDVELMKILLSQKTRQCRRFRDELRKSGALVLVHSTYPKDQFWASGKHNGVKSFPDGFPGRNMHGILVGDERSNLQTEPHYDPDTTLPSGSSSSVSTSDSFKCWACGEVGHKRAHCRHFLRRGACVCNTCGYTGHKSKMCTVAPKESRGAPDGNQNQLSRLNSGREGWGSGMRGGVRRALLPDCFNSIPFYGTPFAWPQNVNGLSNSNGHSTAPPSPPHSQYSHSQQNHSGRVFNVPSYADRVRGFVSSSVST